MKNQRLTAAAALFLALSVPAAGESGASLWRRDVTGAFEAARASGSLILVDVYADWCSWCKVLEREVFPDPAFREVAKDFVLLRIDVDDGAEGSRLAAEHEAFELPTLLILEPSGARTGEVRGYAPVETFVGRLRAQLAIRERVLEAYRHTLESRDADALRRMAADFYGRRDGARAAALLDRLLERPPADATEETWSRVLLADSWRLAGDTEHARGAARRAREAAGRAGPLDDALAEKLDLLEFWIAETAGRCGEAAGALAEFERRHPESPSLAGAHRALDHLRSGPEELCS